MNKTKIDKIIERNIAYHDHLAAKILYNAFSTSYTPKGKQMKPLFHSIPISKSLINKNYG